MELQKGTLGNAIRHSRIENKFTQEELAEKLGITPTHLKHIESEHRKPSIEVLFGLVSILHLSLDSLFLSNSENIEKDVFINEIHLLLQECNTPELKVFLAALRELINNK